jgi:RNA polymerase sigma-70 factor (ECF subfamily)
VEQSRSEGGRLRSGESDVGTLADFLERNRARGTAHCRRLVADFHAAEDIYQQACLRLHRRGVDRLHDPAGCRALLYRTLTNLCRDHARAGTRSRKRLPPPPGSPPLEPDRLAQDREDLRRLESALDRLDARQRRALLLKTRTGLSYVEISSRMRVSVSNVGVLIHRAREHLRRMLGGEAHG